MNVIKQFLSDWKTTGAVVATSQFTQATMLDMVDFSRIKLAVEFGPGSGAITKCILSRMRPDATLIGVEINPSFAEVLRERIADSRLEIVVDSATHLPAILEARGPGRADCVFSSLPFMNLPPDLRDEILQAAREGLKPGAQLVALQYTPWVLPRLLRRYFGGYHFRFNLLNVPPAFVYSAARGD
ncbi:MAG: methyltransferase domain-containing protein [Armatimonadetes bacterium]|nr:methyltransferase domain-containing protein [Armatimonadota bacterium]